jgi:putative copper resistance protein D
MALTVLHQIGAAIWVGGVVQLASTWRLAGRDSAVRARWPDLVARFSRLALAALVVLVAAALPLTWVYVGSWDALVGSGYGSLVATKVMLMAGALALGGLNFLAGRRARRGGDDRAMRTQVPHLIETEAILLVILLFAAASLSGQPPPVDTPSERATWSEVVEVFRPKWPSLRTPAVSVMIGQDAVAATAPVAASRTPEAYLWSNFSHNVAGLLLLATSAVALVAWRWPGSPARHWPLGFVGLAVFVLLRTSANDGIWPFGPVGFWASMWGDAEVLQHRLGGFLAVAVGLLEWRARVRSPSPAARLPYVFPVLATAGGVLLLTHSHAAFELKRYYLVQVTHTVMGALAVLMACARLLELRLAPPAGRAAGAASTLAMLLIALVLVFYREANVVLTP